MRYRTVIVIFAAISAINGVLAIAAPGQFTHAIWPERTLTGAELFVRGWGASLLGMSAFAWANLNAQDPFVRRSIAMSLFVYFGAAAGAWFADAKAVGWTIMSAATFVGLSAFASAFGYLRFLKLSAIRRTS